MTIPVSLVSLVLIHQISNSVSSLPLSKWLFDGTILTARLADIRSIYAIENLKNKVVDGSKSFPENQQSLRSGISIEFRLIVFSCYSGVSKACKSEMYRSSTLAQKDMLSETYHSRSELVNFA
jgi:hypothetical protein